jgi:hypothetical protein
MRERARPRSNPKYATRFGEQAKKMAASAPNPALQLTASRARSSLFEGITSARGS